MRWGISVMFNTLKKHSRRNRQIGESNERFFLLLDGGGSAWRKKVFYSLSKEKEDFMAEAQANQEQIRYWNEQSGPRWVKQQKRLDLQLEQLGLAAMQRAGVKPGEHVLDVGC